MTKEKLHEITLKTIEEGLWLDEQNNNFAEYVYGILTLNSNLKEYLSSKEENINYATNRKNF